MCRHCWTKLRKFGKSEIVLVSSSQWTSEENHSKSKVSTVFQVHPGPKTYSLYPLEVFNVFLCRTFYRRQLRTKSCGILVSFKLCQIVSKKDTEPTNFTMEFCQLVTGRKTSKQCPLNSGQTALQFAKLNKVYI